MKINRQPNGLLSLLGVIGGDAPSNGSDTLQVSVEALPFYLAGQIKIDESTAAFVSPSSNTVLYPAVGPVPVNTLRYIVSASANSQWVSGSFVTVCGWRIKRQTGTIPPYNLRQNGTTTNGGTDLVPFPGIEDLILLPGEELGLTTSASAATVGQINFGIRYVDILL